MRALIIAASVAALLIASGCVTTRLCNEDGAYNYGYSAGRVDEAKARQESAASRAKKISLTTLSHHPYNSVTPANPATLEKR